MKKTYETPSVEKIQFQYRDQIVVASGYIPDGTQKDPDGDGDCDYIEGD